MFKKIVTVLLSVLSVCLVSVVSNAQQVEVTAIGGATSSTVQITNMAVPSLISSTSAATTCAPLLVSYNKFGAYGNDVKQLQLFLNRVNGAKLNGKGYYGVVTQQEVKNFQYTYGIKPTGYQHLLTTKMINDIHCGRVVAKDRKVYSFASYRAANISQAVSLGTVVNNSKNLVKEYDTPKSVKLLGTTSSDIKSATRTSFWENLSKDWDRIKENYKAYLLVFALVLALFWFLRKAATE